MKKWILGLWVISFSCRQPTKNDNSIVIQMAELECRAAHLREQRFALANKIRFAQDTLLQLKKASDSIRLNDSLHHYLQEKESLLQTSLQLADTIHIQLDSLRKFSFKTIDDKHVFDEQLQEELKKRGCNK